MTRVKKIRRKNNDGPLRRINRLVFVAPCSLVIVALISIVSIRQALNYFGFHDNEVYHQNHDEFNVDEIDSYEFNPNVGNVAEEIIKGNVHLIQISKSMNKDRTNQSPYSVTGIFCHLDWNIHKTKPSTVPMNKDLIAKSKHCNGSTIRMDIYEAVTQVREYDEKNRRENIASTMHTIEPTGFVFHESRCGSTLVANSLAAYDPQTTRVYSESAPPITAAKMYNRKDEEGSLQLIRDVIYLMGRTNDMKEQNLFFKIQSIGVKSIHIFRKAFPQTPWMFVYRDPVQVMRSHLKVQGMSQAVCLRSKRLPPNDLIDLVQRIGGDDKQIRNLNNEEFCAAHLASLCEAAVKQAKESNGVGRVVNYNNLVNTLMEDLIPKHFLNIESLSDNSKANILRVSEHYSKGRGQKGRAWKEDSEQKEITAWDELKDASAMYLQPSYMELEKLQK